MRVRMILVLLLVALVLPACASRAPLPQRGALTIACSDSFEPLASALTDAFGALYPHVVVQVDVRNNANAHDRLKEGRADVALIAGPLEPIPDDWQQRAAALEGLAVIVHPSRTLSEIGLAQTQMIFSGRILSWDALDGQGSIQPVSRENGSAARDTFESAVMRERAVTSLAIIMPSSAAVVEYVATHPDAIGYVAAHQAGAGTKALRVEGSLPSPDAVKQGTYPLIMTSYLVWEASPKPEAQAFLDFVANPAGRGVIVNAGYVVP
jgi:phosphate transport system substrate-binding protein